MDFLPSHGQVDHPRHLYGRGKDDYPSPINVTPYSAPPVGQVDQRRHQYGRGDEDYLPPVNLSSYPPPPVRPTYNDGPYLPSPYRGSYDQQPPSLRGYNSTQSPYMEYQNYTPPRQQPPNSYVVTEKNNPHMNNPHLPTFIEGKFHNNKPNYNSNTSGKINNYLSDGVGFVGPTPMMGVVANKPSYKIYCKAGGERFAVAIRDGKVILTRPNSSDPTQNWCKDEKYSTKVKDEERQPSFILLNKGTGQAIKHSVVGYPVQLTPYKPDVFDESIMWTESRDLGLGFRTIRTVNNIQLVMDAWNADKDHGGIHDGTVVALYKCWKGDNQNQQWKLVPY